MEETENKTTTNNEYDEAAAAEAERRRLEEIARIEALLAELEAKREQYYEAREMTVGAINVLDQMASNLDNATNELYDCFQINGVNADNGKIDAEIDKVTDIASNLRSQTLSEIDQNIDNLSNQISMTINELNGLHTPGETLHPEDIPKKPYDDGNFGSYGSNTKGTGDGQTFLDLEKFNNLFSSYVNGARDNLLSVGDIIGSIISTVPGDFSGSPYLNGLASMLDDINASIGAIYLDLAEKAQRILAIEGKASSGISSLESSLANILELDGTSAFSSQISNLINTGEINSSYLTMILIPNMVRSGSIDISSLGAITSNLYSNSVITNSDVGTMLFELRRTNLNYSTTQGNLKAYEEKINSMYGYDYEYEENYTDNKDCAWFKIKSEYTYKNSDINEILKPMYDNGLINTDDIREMTSPLTVFNKDAGNPDVYNNTQYSPVTKNYSETDGLFQLTVGNRSYQVNDKDRELIKGVLGFEDFFTGDSAYDDAIADVAVSDFTVAMVTKESSSNKIAIDEANAIASVGINRTESTHWCSTDQNGNGESIVGQYIRQSSNGNQYQPYTEKTYIKYLSGNGYQGVEMAVKDAMNGTRNTVVTGFDNKGTSSLNKVTNGGSSNNFFNNIYIPDSLADKKVEFTGIEYNRSISEGEIAASEFLPVALPSAVPPKVSPNVMSAIGGSQTSNVAELQNQTLQASLDNSSVTQTSDNTIGTSFTDSNSSNDAVTGVLNTANNFINNNNVKDNSQAENNTTFNDLSNSAVADMLNRANNFKN